MNTNIKLPNLIIAGTNKAGSTSAHVLLSAHPQICASNVKELRYFTPGNIERGLPSLEEYAANFSHCQGHTYTMESTPSYFSGGRAVAQAMRKTLGDIHILLFFRNPVDRLLSFFKFHQAAIRIDPDIPFDKYVKICLDGTRSDSWLYNMYPIKCGFYDDLMEQWIDVFDTPIGVFFFDHLINSRTATVKAICAHLDIDPTPLEEIPLINENPTITCKNRTLHRLALLFGNDRFGRRIAIPAGIKRWARHSYYRLNGKTQTKSTMPSATREELDQLYAPHLQRFATILKAENANIILPEWLEGQSAAK